jgi:hypothetical protein
MNKCAASVLRSLARSHAATDELDVCEVCGSKHAPVIEIQLNIFISDDADWWFNLCMD